MQYCKVLFISVIVLAIAGCGSSSSSSSNSGGSSTLAPLSCSGNRIWDTGESDFIVGGKSYVSETNNDPQFQNSKFPCAAFWEYDLANACSDLYTYEGYVEAYAIQGISLDITELGTSGANFVFTIADGTVADPSVPAGISASDLANLPDC